MSDFELAAIHSFKSNFAQVNFKGCLFHLAQSITYLKYVIESMSFDEKLTKTSVSDNEQISSDSDSDEEENYADDSGNDEQNRPNESIPPAIVQNVEMAEFNSNQFNVCEILPTISEGLFYSNNSIQTIVTENNNQYFVL